MSTELEASWADVGVMDGLLDHMERLEGRRLPEVLLALLRLRRAIRIKGGSAYHYFEAVRYGPYAIDSVHELVIEWCEKAPEDPNFKIERIDSYCTVVLLDYLGELCRRVDLLHDKTCFRPRFGVACEQIAARSLSVPWPQAAALLPEIFKDFDLCDCGFCRPEDSHDRLF